LVGQQIVGELANCLTTAVKAAVPALVSKINPVAGMISQGQGVVGSFVNKGPAPPLDQQIKTQAPPADNTKLTPVAAKDPGGAEITKDMTYIDMLNGIVNGEEGGIDWNKASKTTSGKVTISFISTMLDAAATDFAKIATKGEVSTAVKSILETFSQV
jgi:hypothetical protein